MRLPILSSFRGGICIPDQGKLPGMQVAVLFGNHVFQRFRSSVKKAAAQGLRLCFGLLEDHIGHMIWKLQTGILFPEEGLHSVTPLRS